jgi:cobalamin-dependent methionine synthase I
MIIVGELINGSRPAIGQAIVRRDAEVIIETARCQVQAGAQLLDINAGTGPDREAEDLVWLVDVVTGALSSVALCIDSPNPAAMKAGLERAGERGALINSITAERKRVETFLPFIQTHSCQVIALCMNEGGIPKEARQRLRIAEDLVETLTAKGLAPGRIFLDPLVCPISVDAQAGRTAMETTRLIKETLPGVRTICGLSNISFGLPQRRLLNRNFLSAMIAAGLDAAILDPTDTGLMANLAATQALLGFDENCMGYIGAAREGTLS